MMIPLETQIFKYIKMEYSIKSKNIQHLADPVKNYLEF